jgi:hypothetical protein
MSQEATPNKLPDVWASRDYPLLVEICRAIDSGDGIGTQALRQLLGRSADAVGAGLRALERRGLVTCEYVMSGDAYIVDVSGRAYELVGLHPDGGEAVEVLINALRKAERLSDDPDEKGKLRRAANAVADITGQVAAGVMTAVLSRGLA